MVVAWELWTLLWLAALQFAVAWWWRRGPSLKGTEIWVPALFVLNGVATLLGVSQELMSPSAPLGVARKLADKATNPLLFATVLAALPSRRRGLRRAALALAALATLVGAPLLVVAQARTQLVFFLVEAPLLAATFLVPAATFVHAREGADRRSLVWLVVLGAIGFRFAELSVAVFLDLEALAGPVDGRFLYKLLRTATLPALLVALATLVVRRTALEWGDDALFLDTSVALLAGGLLLGWSRLVGSQSILAVLLSLAFVRPLVLFGAQASLPGFPRGRVRRLAEGASVYGMSLLGVALATRLFTGARVFLPVGVTFALLGGLLLRTLDRSGRLPGAEGSPDPEAGTWDGDWPVDPDEVNLPQDWEDRVREGFEGFRGLPEDVRENLAGLSRWQRLILALEGAPEGDRQPAYERTTPGLHLTTHCPYSEIGPAINRANQDRYEAVVEEHDLSPPPGLAGAEEPLVESRLGRAEGLDSPRVKSYELTELGEEVAEALRREVGLDDRPPEEVARVVGEGFPERLDAGDGGT